MPEAFFDLTVSLRFEKVQAQMQSGQVKRKIIVTIINTLLQLEKLPESWLNKTDTDMLNSF